MKFILDSDLHIHTRLSLCSNDSEQTPERILAYAKEYSLKTVCITDHYWDESIPSVKFDFYDRQNTAHVKASLPLPSADGIRFLFGCETDLDLNNRLGISPERYDDFEFIIIPTTHLHLTPFTNRGDEDTAERARLWVSRFDAVLDMDLPFHKVGIAHLTCPLMNRGHHLETLELIPDSEMERIFARAAACGVGIELNYFDVIDLTAEELEITLRPYRIAKARGCKFYFGSDAHHPETFAKFIENAAFIIDKLELTEDDKFVLA